LCVAETSFELTNVEQMLKRDRHSYARRVQLASPNHLQLGKERLKNGALGYGSPAPESK